MPAVPLVTDEPALEDVEPLLECMVVVLPSIVVDDETLPPPAVTDVEVPLPTGPLLSITVQVVPSFSLMLSLAKAVPATITPKIRGKAKAPLCENDAEVIPGPPDRGGSEQLPPGV
ncbi:hypothetical protein ASF70_02090 [Rhizobium sp. Leaf321]|nr:hypothetical protein ASF70_02090 [Rhizobium sp. Leaf321]